MPNFKFYFIHDNLSPEGFSTEVFPLYKDFTIPRKQETNEQYFRREFNGNLTFVKDDYLYLKNWYDTETFCFELLLKVFKVCNDGSEVLEYQGIVALNDFEYDFDRCIITLNKAQTYDIYTLIDKIRDVKVNLLAYTGDFNTVHLGEQYIEQSLELFRIGEIFIGTLPTPFPGSNLEVQELFSEFYENAFNPVTGLANYQYYLMQMSDFIKYDATSPATIGECTFGQYLDWLKYTHNVYLLAEQNIIRLEHVAYYKGGVMGYSREENVSIDLTTPTYLKWIKSLFRFSFDKDRFPELEEWEFQNSKNTDFVGYPIKYSGACVKVGDKRRYILEGLSVDIDYINETTYVVSGDRKNDEVDFDGFVMVAVPFGGDEIVTGNAPLALTYLHSNFHTFNRPLPEGIMNNAPETFLSYIRQKLQTELEFPDCCSLYKSRNLIRNGNFISNSFWQDGDNTEVSSDNIDIVDGALKFKQAEITELPNKDFEAGTGDLFDDWTLTQPSRTIDFLRSNEFTTAPNSAGDSTTTSSTELDPFGGNTGWIFTDSSNTDVRYFMGQTFPLTAGIDNILSIFIKKQNSAPTHYPGFDLSSSSGANARCIINPQTGAIYTGLSTGGVTIVSTGTSLEKNGYIRVWIVVNFTAGTTMLLYNYPAMSSDGLTLSVNATGSTGYFGVNVGPGNIIGPYVPTLGTAVTTTLGEITENTTGGIGASRALELWDNTGGAKTENTLSFAMPGSTAMGISVIAGRGIPGVAATFKLTVDGTTKTQVLTDNLERYTFSFTTTASPGSLVTIENDSSVNYGFMLVDEIRFFFVGTVDYNTERQDLSYIASINTSYILEFTVSNFQFGQVFVKMFETGIGFFTGNGLKTATVQIDDAIDLITNGFLKFAASGVGYEFNIDNVKIYRFDKDLDELTLITSQIGDGEIEAITKTSGGNFKLKLKHY